MTNFNIYHFHSRSSVSPEEINCDRETSKVEIQNKTFELSRLKRDNTVSTKRKKKKNMSVHSRLICMFLIQILQPFPVNPVIVYPYPPQIQTIIWGVQLQMLESFPNGMLLFKMVGNLGQRNVMAYKINFVVPFHWRVLPQLLASYGQVIMQSRP